MSIPLIQQLKVGAYVARSVLLEGRERFPLVLMLEPLFRCNLSCAGCGKIAFPKDVLDRRLGVEECLGAAEECGAPIVSIPGGEPLIHPEIEKVVEGLIRQKRFVYLCTNALLLEERLERFRPTPYLTFSVHLDGLRERHDARVRREGVFDRAVQAIREARKRGFRVTTNTTLYEGEAPEQTARFFDFVSELGVEGMTISPGFEYEKASDRGSFLKRERTRELFRELFRMQNGKRWVFNQSSLYLDFLAGNQDYRCTPWGNPTRNIFGWQRPCYLLNEGYAGSFRELIEETDWDRYGHDRHPACADCMVHSGYEPTAVIDTIRHPLKALRAARRRR